MFSHLNNDAYAPYQAPGTGVSAFEHPDFGTVAIKHCTEQAFEAYQVSVALLKSFHQNTEQNSRSFKLKVSEPLLYWSRTETAASEWIAGITIADLRLSNGEERDRLTLAVAHCMSLTKLAIQTAEARHGAEHLFIDLKPDNIIWCGYENGVPVLCPVDFTLTPRESEIKMNLGQLFFWK